MVPAKPATPPVKCTTPGRIDATELGHGEIRNWPKLLQKMGVEFFLREFSLVLR